jgi:lysyl-tRNA synthetase class I
MDKQLRAEIVATVRQAMLTYNEKWVTADVLCEHVGSLTKRWLRDHGQAFNRTRIEYDDKDGHHEQAWLYPLHEIMQWIQDGRIKELKC